LGFLTD